MLEERDYDFMRVLWARTSVFTYIFFGFNILIFVLMELSGGTTNSATLLAFGVKDNFKIDQGETWRFITPVFIHIGLLHLIFNSYALWLVGPQVEKLYGGARFVLLYVVTGAAGVAGSYWYHPQVPSAGASGAIFGLFGVLLVFGFRYKKTIPPFFQKAVGSGVLPVIVINLVIGFTIPGIDNSAHIGGLLAGALLASVISFEQPGAQPQPTFKVLQVALLLMVAASFYQVYKHYDGPRVSLRNLSRNWGQIAGRSSRSANVDQFIYTLNGVQHAIDSSMDAFSRGDRASLAAARTETARSIDALKRTPSVASNADQIIAKMLKLMEDQYSLLEDSERAGMVTTSNDQRARDNKRKYSNLIDDFQQWAEKDGARYGIHLRKQP